MTRPVYRYGASFVDRATGLRFEGHHPAARPDLWAEYLNGLVREYAHYGIPALAAGDGLDRGEGVSLFFVAIDAEDRVVAGVRCHGPLDDADASQALAEMATSPEWEQHRATVEAATAFGVLEMKGAWRDPRRTDHRVTAPLGRACVHALEWLGTEVLIAAVTELIRDILLGAGGVLMGTESAPYPSEDYRTILFSWRRPRYAAHLAAREAPLVREERQQLLRPPPPGTITGWRPVVLDVARRADRQILANLRADAGIEHLDLSARQRAELARLLPEPDPELVDEPLRHVYYPWRRTVVQMLGPDAFRSVRLDRNRNRITAEEQRHLARQRVGVVGLSAGHSAAATIALEGLCGELRLADFDEVELTNLNRLPASVLDVGVNKAVVAARRVAEIDPYLSVQISATGLTGDNVESFVDGLDVLVEECDELGMKVLVREVAKRHGVPVVMETSDRGMLDVERFDLEPERPILHGLLDGTTSQELASLSVLEKVPHVLRLVDAAQGSARGAASLTEIGRTVSTWPQLGADVTLGGASVAAAVRRIGLGQPVSSGRTRVDLDSAVGSLESPVLPAHLDTPQPAPSPAPADPLLAVAHAATLAPSGGNAQPWTLELTGDELRFKVDHTRRATMDVAGRASYLALGAAVFNAQVAAAAAGLLGPLSLFPDGADSDLVASLAFGGGTDGALATLYPAVLERCTNRRIGAPGPLGDETIEQLEAAVTAEGARLDLVTERERVAEIAEILGASERIRFLTPTLHKDMIGELRWPDDELTTGIDVRTLELSALELGLLDLARREDVMELLAGWDAGGALGDHAKGTTMSSSAVAVVSLPDASPAAYLSGGSAVERLWIAAQGAGLAVQPVSPVFCFAVADEDYEPLGGDRWADDLRGLSKRFRDTLGLGTSTPLALVIRLSHAPAPSARSIRRPLGEVVHRP